MEVSPESVSMKQKRGLGSTPAGNGGEQLKVERGHVGDIFEDIIRKIS